MSAEPSEVVLHVDGANDPCSLQQDVNFEFLGFSVYGTVRCDLAVTTELSVVCWHTLCVHCANLWPCAKVYTIDGGQFSSFFQLVRCTGMAVRTYVCIS